MLFLIINRRLTLQCSQDMQILKRLYLASSSLSTAVVQGNATLCLGRKRDGPEGLWDSVGGFATLPQVFLGRLEEAQVRHIV